MDDLDRIQAAEDEARERSEARKSLDCGSAMLRDGTEKPPKHNITIFGCIKTETGWYRLGFDEETRSMIPLEKV